MFESPEIEKILRTVHEAALEKKGEDPVLLDLRGLTSITDYFFLVSGWSDRQVRAILREIHERLLDFSLRPIHLEGEENGRWVLADYGAFVIHIFLHETRKFYDLEHLWADAPRIDLSGKMAVQGETPPPHRE